MPSSVSAVAHVLGLLVLVSSVLHSGWWQEYAADIQSSAFSLPGCTMLHHRAQVPLHTDNGSDTGDSTSSRFPQERAVADHTAEPLFRVLTAVASTEDGTSATWRRPSHGTVLSPPRTSSILSASVILRRRNQHQAPDAVARKIYTADSYLPLYGSIGMHTNVSSHMRTHGRAQAHSRALLTEPLLLAAYLAQKSGGCICASGADDRSHKQGNCTTKLCSWYRAKCSLTG